MGHRGENRRAIFDLLLQKLLVHNIAPFHVPAIVALPICLCSAPANEDPTVVSELTTCAFRNRLLSLGIKNMQIRLISLVMLLGRRSIVLIHITN